jgi:hypothetical protein
MSGAVIRALGKPTAQEDTKARLAEVTKALLESTENGDVIGFIGVVLRPDRTFSIYQSGDLKRLEAIGMLETAKHDLLHDNET